MYHLCCPQQKQDEPHKINCEEHPMHAHFAEKPFVEQHFLYGLHMCVLAVALTRIEGAWCAYIAPVPGQTHSEEYQAVLDHGEKLPEAVALALWPCFKGVPYAR